MGKVLITMITSVRVWLHNGWVINLRRCVVMMNDQEFVCVCVCLWVCVYSCVNFYFIDSYLLIVFYFNQIKQTSSV